MRLLRIALAFFAIPACLWAEEPLKNADYRGCASEGQYPGHLQGIDTNGKDRIYWSWTTFISVTDTSGKLLKQVPAENHQGDLCYVDGRIYIAVNQAKFNHPDGLAKNWISVRDANTLDEIARHSVPEVTHGAGGIAHHNGRFIVAGGLPVGTDENYLYEYDREFRFVKKHVLKSGYTKLGIQTVAYENGFWFFGCYGKPAVVLRTNNNFEMLNTWNFDASLGIAPLSSNRFLIGSNIRERNKHYRGHTKVFTLNADLSLPFQPVTP
jgi:hypothetical protein